MQVLPVLCSSLMLLSMSSTAYTEEEAPMCFKPEQPPVSAKRIINISALEEENFDSFFEGNFPDVIVEFPASTQFPLTLSLKGDLLKFVGEENHGCIEVQQTFYATCSSDCQFLFSTDLKEWKSLSDFAEGRVSISFLVEQDQPFVKLGGELNQLQTNQ